MLRSLTKFRALTIYTNVFRVRIQLLDAVCVWQGYFVAGFYVLWSRPGHPGSVLGHSLFPFLVNVKDICSLLL